MARYQVQVEDLEGFWHEHEVEATSADEAWDAAERDVAEGYQSGCFVASLELIEEQS